MPKARSSSTAGGSAQGARKARAWCDWLKVYMTHRSWVDKQGNLVSSHADRGRVESIVDEAHGWQKKVAACVQRDRLQRALDGDAFHRARFEMTDAQIAQMLRQGLVLPDAFPYYDDGRRRYSAGSRRARAAVHEITFRRAAGAFEDCLWNGYGGFRGPSRSHRNSSGCGLEWRQWTRFNRHVWAAEMLDMKGELVCSHPALMRK